MIVHIESFTIITAYRRRLCCRVLLLWFMFRTRFIYRTFFFIQNIPSVDWIIFMGAKKIFYWFLLL